MELSLQGKKAFVCGSTQGIGKAIALELAQLGAHITLIARNEDKLQAVLKELSPATDRPHDYICADFAKPEDLQQKVARYLDEHPQAHILINNTGGPAGGLAIEAEPESYLEAFRKHLVCNQLLAQTIVPRMKEAQYGRIINIISTSVKQPIKGLGVSNTIRGAVANWSKTLSFELGADGITVNNVLPGATRTNRLTSLIENKAKKSGQSIEQVEAAMQAQIPAARFAEAHEVANAAAFLASPAAAYINGVNIPVDGGRLGSL